MPVLQICRYPDAILRSQSKPVRVFNNHFRGFVKDLLETMATHPGCVGISAPQVGKAIRVVAVDVSRHRKTSVHHGRVVLANPVFLRVEGTVAGREGCLSIPEYTGNLCRSNRILIEGQNIYGSTVAIQTEGFEAVAFQHEVDHLDGILFIDRIRSLKTDIFRRK